MTEQDTPKMTHDEMIDTLKGLVFGTFDRTTAKEREALDMAISYLSENKGEWKLISPAGIYECSCCGQDVMTSDIECYKFCHGCGARMDKAESEGGKTKYYLCEWKCAFEVEAQDENEAKTKYAEMLSNDFFTCIYPEDIEVIDRGEE